ncbi:hypothetical protein FRC03_011953 [Tulasnella sp. 419]|nr:hypothetical protein FRC03_011953 [Tulasnella sp. 419]
MATLETRPYTGNYSGLKNQAILAVCIGSICLTSFELMRRKRRNVKSFIDARKNGQPVGLESVESWEWGYLYQGRCWAKRPSPPLPRWPLAWVKQMIQFPEEKLLPLVGPDTTVYARFLRGCFYFTLLHSLTTVPILLPIHVVYSPPSIPPKSMTRASLSSLVASPSGQKLLVIHLILLIWIALTWIINLLWLCKGAFRYRMDFIHFLATEHDVQPSDTQHPTSPHDELDTEESEEKRRNRGWRLRTIMVSNIPPQLRDEKTLKEYFEFYMSRPLHEPPPAPGLVSGIVSFISRFTQARGIKKAAAEESVPPTPIRTNRSSLADDETLGSKHTPPKIEKVLVVRKMTELASLLDRREEVLRKLEEAHIKLANKALGAAKEWFERKRNNKSPCGMLDRVASRRSLVRKSMSHPQVQEKEEMEMGVDLERGGNRAEMEQEEAMMEVMANALEPFLYEFGLLKKEGESVKAKEEDEKVGYKWPLRFKFDGMKPSLYSQLGKKKDASEDSNHTPESDPRPSNNDTYPPRRSSTTNSSTSHSSSSTTSEDLPLTIWEALHNIPRDHLDAFQPLIRLNSLFRGATVPSIDYHTAKLGLLTALINENRSRPTTDFAPASTAFVTFERYEDARVAVKCLPSHPKNPLTCLVVPAPEWGDLDWARLMTRTFTGEFLKDWVVDLGVWAFTCFWIIPVSFLVSLVSIDNLSIILPWLKTSPSRREILSSLIPTLLVTLLAILVPLLLLLLAKKAHTIVLLSKLHDQIMTRYHKFLVCNVLIFFCVGVFALQSFLESFRQPKNPLPVIAEKFPIAAPFYVGWCTLPYLLIIIEVGNDVFRFHSCFPDCYACRA